MAWIESHQTLAHHPKVKRLARDLGVKDPDLAHHAAVSLLQHLWWWAMDYAEDGNLDGFTAEDIADACQWPARKADRLVTALVDAGWLDRRGDALHVHNYARYIARLLQRREQNRERARTSRARHADGAHDSRVACDATGTGTNRHQPEPPVVPLGKGDAAARTGGADRQRRRDRAPITPPHDLARAIALANYDEGNPASPFYRPEVAVPPAVTAAEDTPDVG